MPRYHAHIYFSPSDQQRAESLWLKIKSEIESEAIKVGPLEPGLRGPHLMSQFEVDFPESHLEAVFGWLLKHRTELSILIHPELEDEIKSHLNDAIWMGIPLPLNYAKLDLRTHGRAFVPFGEKPAELDS
jgi:aromatic ring-cleaving dioxygenase